MGIFSALNPFMPLLGVLAVASPIIIHLLNKRRYKIINWAAMDFLFEADKKNRRRVKLENFILLLLRCLAMLLIGLFLARMFLPSALTKAFSNTQQFQHIVILDDSLSQSVQVSNQSSLDKSKDAIKQLLNQSVNNNRDDWLTVILTSQPEKPFIDNEPVDANKLNSLLQRIDDIKVSDQAADYDTSLLEIEGLLQDQKENVNRVVYVVTDLRQQDWQRPEGEENAPNKIVERLGTYENVLSTFLVDVGNDVEENLTITSIKTEDKLVAETNVRFEVTVTNQGRKPADNIQIRFQVDDSATSVQTDSIESLAPGESQTKEFQHLFQLHRGDDRDNEDVRDQIADNLKNYKVQAEIVHDGVVVDSLTEDSTAYFAARVLDGIPVLLVDGDPSAVSERSDTHYLRSLEVSGAGLIVDTITVSELETISLAKYKAIFLCNVDEAGKERIDALKQWTNEGGGLVFLPGDQVRASTFNEAFYDSGLSPIKLTEILGDSSQSDWKLFSIDTKNRHPAFDIVLSLEDNLFEKIETFNWWGSTHNDKDKAVQVYLRMTDENSSVAMAERTIGQGRVVTLTMGADADWTNWPQNEVCYPLVIIPMIEYLIGNISGDSQVKIGGEISHLVDLSSFNRDVSLINPEKEKIDTTTKAADENDASSIMQRATFDEIDRRGIYKLVLKPKDARETREVFFAANVEPDEGDLKRLDMQVLGKEYFGAKTRLVSDTELAAETVSTGNSEIWYAFLVTLGVILGIEQFLGWWFGRKR